MVCLLEFAISISLLPACLEYSHVYLPSNLQPLSHSKNTLTRVQLHKINNHTPHSWCKNETKPFPKSLSGRISKMALAWDLGHNMRRSGESWFIVQQSTDIQHWREGVTQVFPCETHIILMVASQQLAAANTMHSLPTTNAITPAHGKIQDKDTSFYKHFNVVIGGLDNVEAWRWVSEGVAYTTSSGLSFLMRTCWIDYMNIALYILTNSLSAPFYFQNIALQND